MEKPGRQPGRIRPGFVKLDFGRLESSLRGLVIIILSAVALRTSTIDFEKFWMPDLAFSLQNQAFQTPKVGRQPGRIRPGFANLDFR